MTQAALKAPRWKITLRGADQFAEDLGLTGCWVGPRTGPMKRTQGQKEDYVLRHLLVAMKYAGALEFPIELSAATNHKDEPDFVLHRPSGRALGIEATEAGEEDYQAWLTRTEAHSSRDEASKSLDVPFDASTPRTLDEWIRAVRRKVEKFDAGSYRGSDECDLVVFDNTSWGGFLVKKQLIADLAGSAGQNDLRGRFRQVHFVCGSLVWLDVFGEQRLQDVSRTYEIDYAAWVSDQVDTLRRKDGADIDVANLLEEVESLGKSEQRAFASYLRNLKHHLLKWQFQPEGRSPSWQTTIELARAEVQERLMEMPSLKGQLGPMADREYQRAIRLAANETGLALDTFPEHRPFTNEQLVDPDFLPEGTNDG